MVLIGGSKVKLVSANGYGSPDIEVDGNNIHVVWEDHRGTNPRIYYRKSVDNGVSWQEEKKIFESVYEWENPSPVLAINDKGLYVIYMEGDYLYCKISPDFGNTWEKDIEIGRISGGTTNRQAYLMSKGDVKLGDYSIVADKNGIHIVWQQWWNFDIYYRKSIDGRNWTDPVKIAEPETAEGLVTSFNCGIVADRYGKLHLFWEQVEGGLLNNHIIFLYYICYKRNFNEANWTDYKNLTICLQPAGWPSVALNDRNIYIAWREENKKIYYKSSPIDPTPPSTPVVTDSGKYTSSTTQLHIQCQASDLESGIAEYQYAIGTYPGEKDIVDWTSIGTNTEITITGLSLTHGRSYYVAVKARNPVGLWSEVGYSDGIKVDITPPSKPVVTDGGKYTASTSCLSCDWSSSDPESGVEYFYAVGTTQGGTNTVDWRGAGSSRGINLAGLSLEDWTTYYFTVKAKNGAGLWSDAGYSDGITVGSDSTPPIIANPQAIPNPANPGQQARFTAQIRDNISGLKSVTINLSSINGSSNQPMYDNATNGDEIANDGTYTFTYTIPISVTEGTKTLTITAKDNANNLATQDIILTITKILGGTISGKVTIVETGSPLKGVRIEVLQNGSIKASTTTGSDGAYLIPNLIPGVYNVKASINGIIQTKNATVNPNQTTILEFSFNQYTYQVFKKDVYVESRRNKDYTFYLYPSDPRYKIYTMDRNIHYCLNADDKGTYIDYENNRLVIKVNLRGYTWNFGWFKKKIKAQYNATYYVYGRLGESKASSMLPMIVEEKQSIKPKAFIKKSSILSDEIRVSIALKNVEEEIREGIVKIVFDPLKINIKDIQPPVFEEHSDSISPMKTQEENEVPKEGIYLNPEINNNNGEANIEVAIVSNEIVYFNDVSTISTTAIQNKAIHTQDEEESIFPIANLVIKTKAFGISSLSNDDILSLISISSIELKNSSGEKIEVELEEKDESSLPPPKESQLLQSYPNPADNGCYIPFKLSNDANVSLEIYNILGQRVRTIEAGQRKAGSYTQKDRAIFWDLKNDSSQNVSKGLYFYKIKAGDFSSCKSMVVR